MNKMYKLPFLWECRKIVLYSFFTCKALWDFKKISVLGASIRDFIPWWKHLRKEMNPLDFDRPWITFQAKHFLDSILTKDMSVFEYGSGSSTLYFTKRVGIIYSIENDKQWYENIRDYLDEQKIEGVKYTLVEGKPVESGTDSLYTTTFPQYKNMDFEEYVKSIHSFPEKFFDIVFIDGRSRNRCIEEAIPHVKKGGYLIVDNSEREEYLKGHTVLFDPERWESCHFTGPIPYAFQFSRTSFFRKR